MKNQNNKISRKKFLDLLKNYNEFDLNDASISEDRLEDSTKVLNIKGHIKAYMKQNKSNNNDKLDLILNKINDMNIRLSNLEFKVDNGFKEVNSRIDNIEGDVKELKNNVKIINDCPTIKKETSFI